MTFSPFQLDLPLFSDNLTELLIRNLKKNLIEYD